MKMLLNLFILLLTACGTGANFLINCGLPKSQNNTFQDRRAWWSDDGAPFSPPDINDVAPAASAYGSGSRQFPYSYARIFRSSLTYSFLVTPGPKFLRLYFSTSPTLTYNNISASQSFLSLQANGFTLFHNFSALLNSQRQYLPSYGDDGSYVEFYVPVDQKNNPSTFNLTFSSPDYGFINAIEIVSVPDGLYLNDNGTSQYYQYDANFPDTGYTMLGATSFQTAYRLVAGAADVQPENDSGGLGRTWYSDESYIFGDFRGLTTYPTGTDYKNVKINYTKVSPDAAPKTVYDSQRFMWKTSPGKMVPNKMNLTWRFWVDPGFDYLLRLHFCENDRAVTMIGQRQFHVLVNNLMAVDTVDVWALTGGLLTPIFVDCIFHMYGGGDGVGGVINATTGKARLLLTLRPHYGTATSDVLLNGLEILKLNQSNGSLVAPNPPSAVSSIPNKEPNTTTSGSKQRTLAITGGAIGGSILVILVITCVYFCTQRVNAKNKANMDKSKTKSWVSVPSFVSGSIGTTTTAGSSLPSDLCRRFSLSQIRVATSDFDDSSIIGTGGFGKVYKGVIDGGATTVAIKRLNPTSKQGAHEFLTEIEMLSRLRHLHLVSLIGYCEDQGEMILVYEYMPRGTLRDHLMYKNTDINSPPLSWNQRLKICIGSARGLHYLHVGTKELIIHRDVKSTNILLDERWTAKVSDFGLSKVAPTSESGVGHVSTAVKGSVGYLDPEYYKRQRLTEKSDLYSFGVVLFEVLCARPAANPNLPREQVNLALWARKCYKEGALKSIVDPNLTGQIAPECLNKFGEIAEMCVRDEGSQRPSMGDVVGYLEFALQLQETADKNNNNMNNGGPQLESLGPIPIPIEVNKGTGDASGATDDDGHGSNMFSATVEDLSHSSGTEALMMGKSNSSTTSEWNYGQVGMRSGSIFSEIKDPQAR